MDKINKQYRILVVDDEPVIRTLAATMLKALNYDILLASSGEESLSVFNQERNHGRLIDLIVMDMGLPGMNGAETTRALNKEGYIGPIVLSSGDHICQKFENENLFQGLMFKPYAISKMSKVIGSTISKYKN